MSTMLKYFYDNNLVSIEKQQPKDWRQALNQSTQSLIDANLVTKDYVNEIIQNVVSYGPYIVIQPGIVMPHALSTSPNVLGTGISFTKFNQPVYFDEGNYEKQGNLFFTLAAKDETQHLENIQKLMSLLMRDGVIESLQSINTEEDYIRIMNSLEQISTT